VAGLVAGMVGAALGIGGGVILVPILHLGFGFALADAVGTSLLVIVGTSIAGAAGYLDRDLVMLDVALELQVGSMLGAVAAALAAPLLPERVVAAVFAAAMVAAALTLWLRRGGEGGFFLPEEGARRWTARLLAPAGGAAAGLLGIGGGLVQVPILRLILGLEMRRSVATSTLMVGWTASVAGWIYLQRGAAAPEALPWVLAGILLGAALAPGLTVWMPRRLLELGFSAAALYGAYRMVLG